MRILENRFDIEVETWDDPGDYPNALAAGPLPSYQYVCEVPGRLIVQLEFGDDDPGEEAVEIAQEHADLPDGVTVTKWDMQRDGDKLTFEVADFEAERPEREGPDPDELRDAWLDRNY